MSDYILDFNKAKRKKEKLASIKGMMDAARKEWDTLVVEPLTDTEYNFLKQHNYTTPNSFYVEMPATTGFITFMSPTNGMPLSVGKILDGWLNISTFIKNREEEYSFGTYIVKLGEALFIINKGSDYSTLVWYDATYATANLDFNYAYGYLRGLDRAMYTDNARLVDGGKYIVDINTRPLPSDPENKLNHIGILATSVRELVFALSETSGNHARRLTADALRSLKWKTLNGDLSLLQKQVSTYKSNRFNLGGYSLTDSVFIDKLSLTRTLLTTIMATIRVGNVTHIPENEPVTFYKGLIDVIVSDIGFDGVGYDWSEMAECYGLDNVGPLDNGVLVIKSRDEIETDLLVLANMVKITAPYFNNLFNLLLGE